MKSGLSIIRGKKCPCKNVSDGIKSYITDMIPKMVYIVNYGFYDEEMIDFVSS